MDSDREAFENAIRENPRDAAPRLIYSDWLEERGETAEAIAHRILAYSGSTRMPRKPKHTERES